MTTKENASALTEASHQTREEATTQATSTEELQFHEYANLFPLIEGAEFDALVQDIKANGLRKRIVIFDGKILDGRNRYRAAMAAGIKLTGITNEDDKLVAPTWSTHFISLDLETQSLNRQTQDDALRFVLSENLHRRHLTDAQRAAIAADIANLGNGERKSASPNGGGAVSQADAAKLLNTSKRAVERAAKRKKSDPAAHEAAKAGKVERKPRPRREWKPKQPMCKMDAEQSDRIHRSTISMQMNNFLNQEPDRICAAKIAIEKLQEFLSKADPQQKPLPDQENMHPGDADVDWSSEAPIVVAKRIQMLLGTIRKPDTSDLLEALDYIDKSLDDFNKRHGLERSKQLPLVKSAEPDPANETDSLTVGSLTVEYVKKVLEILRRMPHDQACLYADIARLALVRIDEEYPPTQHEDEDDGEDEVEERDEPVTNNSQESVEVPVVETVSTKPSIATDPERLKKLEQWRRQHTKSVYGSTAGGVK